MNVHRHHALTNLVPADPRINQESPLLFWPRFEEEEEEENFVVPDLDGYLAWLDETAAAGEGGFGTRTEASLVRNARGKRLHHLSLIHTVIHQEEARPDTLVLIPPAHFHRWFRSDDTIEAFLAQRRRPQLIPGASAGRYRWLLQPVHGRRRKRTERQPNGSFFSHGTACLMTSWTPSPPGSAPWIEVAEAGALHRPGTATSSGEDNGYPTISLRPDPRERLPPGSWLWALPT